MNKLYKLYVSISANINKATPMNIIIYEYNVSSVKNKYVEIEGCNNNRRISFSKLTKTF